MASAKVAPMEDACEPNQVEQLCGSSNTDANEEGESLEECNSANPPHSEIPRTETRKGPLHRALTSALQGVCRTVPGNAVRALNPQRRACSYELTPMHDTDARHGTADDGDVGDGGVMGHKSTCGDNSTCGSVFVFRGKAGCALICALLLAAFLFGWFAGSLGQPSQNVKPVLGGAMHSAWCKPWPVLRPQTGAQATLQAWSNRRAISVDQARKVILVGHPKVGTSSIRTLSDQHGWRKEVTDEYAQWTPSLTDQQLAQYQILSFKRSPELKFRSSVSEIWFRLGMSGCVCICINVSIMCK